MLRFNFLLLMMMMMMFFFVCGVCSGFFLSLSLSLVFSLCIDFIFGCRLSFASHECVNSDFLLFSISFLFSRFFYLQISQQHLQQFTTTYDSIEWHFFYVCVYVFVCVFILAFKTITTNIYLLVRLLVHLCATKSGRKRMKCKEKFFYVLTT